MRDNRAPALFGAVLLHALVFGAGLVSLPFWGKPITLEDAVPITIVSHAPPAPPPATEEAQMVTPERTPEPQPTPEPAPTRPTEPEPAPMPAPRAAPAPKARPTPLDLSALAKSLPQSKSRPSRNARAAAPVDLSAIEKSLLKSSGARGRPQPSTGPVINLGPPKPLSGDELGAVTAKLIRLWRPNCGAEGVGKVVVQVEMKLSADGRLTGPPRVLNQPLVDAAGPVAQASAQRALSAVQQGQPYTELPRDRYSQWKDIIVGFDAKHACSVQ